MAGSPPAGDPAGEIELRRAIARWAGRSRSVAADASTVIVTSGAQHAVDLVARVLLEPGDTVAVENPGYLPVARLLRSLGANVVGVPVDDQGLVVSQLPPAARIVCITPSHQYPLGVVMSMPRRRELLAWAGRHDAAVIEDDYDSEFRYDVAPLPALFGLEPDVVVYLGTTAKTLTPAMGVGWLVARRDLAEVIAGAKQDISDRTPEAAQHALLALLGSGDLDRHVRRMRREYARRRAAIVAVLGDLPGPARLLGDTAGLHVVLELPPGTADQVAAAARRRGVAVQTLDRYFAGQPTAGGLVLGYGGASVSQVSRACQVLRQIVAALPDAAAGS
jgi:GntR family transcriptional regulator/MocR family aminotransferase